MRGGRVRGGRVRGGRVRGGRAFPTPATRRSKDSQTTQHKQHKEPQENLCAVDSSNARSFQKSSRGQQQPKQLHWSSRPKPKSFPLRNSFCAELLLTRVIYRQERRYLKRQRERPYDSRRPRVPSSPLCDQPQFQQAS